MIKALIFDCWGTLFTNTQKPHPFITFADKIGYDINDRLFLKSFEQHIMTDAGSLAEHTTSLLIDLNINPQSTVVDELVAVLLSSLPTQVAYDDTAEVLNKLKVDYQLILLSNTFQDGFENLRTNYPIDNWFESQYLSYREHMIKPNVALYDKILADTQLHKDEVLMIGDNYDDDVVAANDTGIQAILLDRRDRYPHVLNDKILSLYELPAMLELKQDPNSVTVN